MDITVQEINLKQLKIFQVPTAALEKWKSIEKYNNITIGSKIHLRAVVISILLYGSKHGQSRKKGKRKSIVYKVCRYYQINVTNDEVL